MNRRTLLSGICALPMAACSSAYSDLPVASAGSTARYTLGPSVGAHTGAGTVGAVFHPLAEESGAGENE